MAQVHDLGGVVAAYGFSEQARVTPMEGGLINQTFLVEQAGRRTVLQRLHAIFAPTVHLDIEVITAHLADKGLATPRLLRTIEGELWTLAADGGVWRMLSFLPGRTLQQVESAASAHAAGQLVARFHRAVSDLRHTFHFTRPGAHDTAAHLATLRRVLGARTDHPQYAPVSALAARILTHAQGLEPLPAVPPRIIHGDLKISNLLFNEAGDQALALLDLDTMAELTIPIELGDALRSWCNPAGEEAGAASLRPELFRAAIEGYSAEGKQLLDQDERGSLVLATETIALELSARFCADALEESYFGWNPKKYPTRSAHNLVRAQSQLALAESVRAQRSALEAFVRTQLAP